MKAFITNLGKYNEGYLIGEWVEFPCDEEDFTEVLKKIEVGKAPYEEWFVTDYESDMDCDGLGEYVNFERLQELGELEDKYGNLAIAISEADGIGYLTEHECENRILFQGIYNDDDLGYYVVDEGLFGITIPDALYNYIDFEAIGREWAFDGTYTSVGFLLNE